MGEEKAQEEYKTALEDFASIIAQETCGLVGGIPEETDNRLARVFIKMVNHGARHAVSEEKFENRVVELLDRLEFEGENGLGRHDI